MNLSKNSWHYKFLDRWEARIILMGARGINLCPYVRAVIGHLIFGFGVVPVFISLLIFVAFSPAVYLLFWFLTEMHALTSLVGIFAMIVAAIYTCAGTWALFYYSWLGSADVRREFRVDVAQSLPYQAAKSWHDKVCPIMDIKE